MGRLAFRLVQFGMAICLVFAFTTAVSAYEEGLNKLTLSIDVSIGNDSNIVETADAIDDNFLTIIPQLVLTLPRDQSFFYLAYSLRNDNYFDNSDFNNTSHNVDFLSRFMFAESFTFELKDKYVDSLYGLWRAETDSISGDGYFTNDINPVLKYDSLSGLFAFTLGYSYMLERWDGLDTRDWDQNKVSANVGFSLGTFTRLGVFGEFVTKDFDTMLYDYDGYFAGLQLDYAIPQVVDIVARAGYETRDYADIDETPSQTSFEIQLRKIFSEITAAKFGVSYRFADSEVYLGDYYTSLAADLDLNYLFQERVQLFVRGQYMDNQYEFTSREDTLTRLYAGAGYKFLDYLALQLFYNYSVRDSNENEFDIEDSRIELHLQFLKDFLF